MVKALPVPAIAGGGAAVTVLGRTQTQGPYDLSAIVSVACVPCGVCGAIFDLFWPYLVSAERILSFYFGAFSRVASRNRL